MVTNRTTIKLTKYERTALENVSNGKDISFRIWQSLQAKKLVGYDEGRDEDYLTPLGRCALKDSQQPAAAQAYGGQGEAVDLAQLRIDLDTMDSVYRSLPDQWSDSDRQRFNEAQFAVNLNLSSKLHMLFDEIDRLQRELKATKRAALR